MIFTVSLFVVIFATVLVVIVVVLTRQGPLVVGQVRVLEG